MNYRRWPPTRKIAYWLATAALVASACFLLTNKGFGPSSASPPDSGSLGPALSATNPGAPRTDAGVAPDLPAAAGTTASTAAGAAREILVIAEVEETAVGKKSRGIRFFVNRRTAHLMQAETGEHARLR